MSKIDKVVLDRATDTNVRLLELQDLRAQTARRLNRLNKQIDELITARAEADLAILEVEILVADGTIISEIPIKEVPVIESPIIDEEVNP